MPVFHFGALQTGYYFFVYWQAQSSLYLLKMMICPSVNSKLVVELYVLASLIILINFDNESYPYIDPFTLWRHWKSLAACQITPFLHALGMAGSFTWNSCLEKGQKTWGVWQLVPCLHMLGTSRNLVDFRENMNLYMTCNVL
jgi:hypothetical protein